MDAWTKEHPFPIDIDYMISDTLELLRPKMRISSSMEDASRQVLDLEREVLVKLGEGKINLPVDGPKTFFCGIDTQRKKRNLRAGMEETTLTHCTFVPSCLTG